MVADAAHTVRLVPQGPVPDHPALVVIIGALVGIHIDMTGGTFEPGKVGLVTQLNQGTAF